MCTDVCRDVKLEVMPTELGKGPAGLGRFDKPHLPRYVFARFYLGLGQNTPPVKDELFDVFAIGDYIEKYCQCKQ